MTEVEEFFLNKCKKIATNSFPSLDLYKSFEKKERIRQRYRHPDLDDMSIKAFENGENYFYCEPVNPNNPNGKQVKCEPKYVYECHVKLTSEEYEELVSKCE